MNISIGNDHAGTNYKLELLSYLTTQGHTVINHGTDDEDSMDYPIRFIQLPMMFLVTNLILAS